MRIVSGTARGRRLQAPPGKATRPTSDRVREALFNILGSLGLPEGAEVADLFAGSGALGLEALSRGARRAVFVEDDPRAVGVIDSNLRQLGFADRADVVRADVMRYLERAAPVDLAFCDPPYAFDAWSELLGRLPAELVAIESDRVVEVPPEWEVIRGKRYGSTFVLIAARRPIVPTE